MLHKLQRTSHPWRHRLTVVRTNFVSAFKDKVKKEFEQNKEIQKALKDLREDKTLSSATQAARDAAAGLQQKVQQASSSVSEAVEKATDKAATAASDAKQHMDTASAKASTVHEDSSRSSSQPGMGAGAASDDGRAAEGNSGSSGASDRLPPLHQRILGDATSLFNTIRERVQGRMGNNQEEPPAQPSTSTEIVVKQPTFWEKTFNFASDSPFMRGFAGFFDSAAGGLGDRIFGETEQAEAVRDLREQLPSFSIETFLQQDMNRIAPEVLKAYLKGDIEALSKTTREAAFGSLKRSVMEREAHQLQVDPRILHISEPELEGIRFVGGQPTPVVSFQAHQLNCVRSTTTKKVVEGDEDDIREVHYLFALQLTELDPGETEANALREWQVTELAVRGMQSVY